MYKDPLQALLLPLSYPYVQGPTTSTSAASVLPLCTRAHYKHFCCLCPTLMYKDPLQALLLPLSYPYVPHCYSQPVSLALTRVLCHNCRLLSLKRCLWIRALKSQGTQWHALLLRRRLKSGSYLLSSRARLQKLSHRLSTRIQAIPCVASFIQKLSLRYASHPPTRGTYPKTC